MDHQINYFVKVKPESEQALVTIDRYNELKNVISILNEADSFKSVDIIDTSIIVNNNVSNDSIDDKVDN